MAEKVNTKLRLPISMSSDIQEAFRLLQEHKDKIYALLLRRDSLIKKRDTVAEVADYYLSKVPGITSSEARRLLISGFESEIDTIEKEINNLNAMDVIHDILGDMEE